MKSIHIAWLTTLSLFSMVSVHATTETIALMRHGEKPSGGYGQINCQGLNRSLHLPLVLKSKYGQPNYIFAPEPSLISDPAGNFNYIRPLATIEPTAIALGLPVYTPYSYSDTSSMVSQLSSASYASDVIFVAWEHSKLVTIAQGLLSKNGGNASAVPSWSSSDFDSIYVVTITRSGGSVHADFRVDHQNLNGQSTSCPHG